MASFQSLKRYSVPKRDNKGAAKHLADKRRQQRAALRVVQQGLMDDVDWTPIPRFVRPARVGEKKGMDTDISTGAVVDTTNTNANIYVTNLVQQGAGSWNRVGRKIHSTSLRIKGFTRFTMVPTVATGITILPSLRMVVVWDKQPSGAAIPAFDNIFGITAQDGTESCPDITCPPRYDNMDRYQILRDCFWNPPAMAIAATGTGPSNTIAMEVDEYIALPRLESVYSGQSTPMTIADISTGALYVCIRQTAQGGGTSSAQFDGIARLRYND